jgi:cell division protein FtsB
VSYLSPQFADISSSETPDVVDTPEAVGQALTSRLDTIKEQYREELEPLTAQREALQREIAELRETREQILEESTALTAKNEELAELNIQLTRQNEMLQDGLARGRGPTIFSKRTHPSGSPSMSSLATAGTLHEVPEETARVVKVTRPEPSESAPKRTGFKWMKSSKGPDMSGSSASISKPLMLAPGSNRNLQRPSTEMGMREHSFQQYSTMRLTRCELCQEKMWGLQEVRCSCESLLFEVKTIC